MIIDNLFQYKHSNIKISVIWEKHEKKGPYIDSIVHWRYNIVNFWSSYFVFACLYSFLNIYYKYKFMDFPSSSLIKTPRLLDMLEISSPLYY